MARTSSRLLKPLRDRSGNVLLLTAFGLSMLCGFVGLAVDGGNAYLTRRAAQTAADAGAMEGVLELNWAANDNTTVTAAAQGAASQNGFTDGSNGVTVAVNNGPLTGPHANDANYVEVIVTKQVPTTFMRILGESTLTVQARAVGGPGANAGCVYTVGTSGTGLDVSGNASLTLNNCTIYDESTDPSKALTASGGGSISATSINVVGGYTETGNNFNPTPTTGVVSMGDPLAFLPEPTVPATCGAALSYSGGNVPLSPGCIDGLTVSGQTTVTLQPGLYIINGNLSITGGSTITGTGVTFYVTGTTNLAGTGTMNLSAPTSGVYNGILYFQSRTDSNAASFSGSSGSNVAGVFYAPDAAFTYSGSNGSSSTSADFVVKSLSITGHSGFTDYNKLNGQSPLQSVTMVE